MVGVDLWVILPAAAKTKQNLLGRLFAIEIFTTSSEKSVKLPKKPIFASSSSVFFQFSLNFSHLRNFVEKYIFQVNKKKARERKKNKKSFQDVLEILKEFARGSEENEKLSELRKKKSSRC